MIEDAQVLSYLPSNVLNNIMPLELTGHRNGEYPKHFLIQDRQW